jgi:hypothetical protein
MNVGRIRVFVFQTLWRTKMTDADFAYLMIVVGAFSMFMLVLGYYMFSVPSRD